MFLAHITTDMATILKITSQCTHSKKMYTSNADTCVPKTATTPTSMFLSCVPQTLTLQIAHVIYLSGIYGGCICIYICQI